MQYPPNSIYSIYLPLCPHDISVLTLLLNVFKASSTPVPKVIPAWQVYSPEPRPSALSGFTTAGFV